MDFHIGKHIVEIDPEAEYKVFGKMSDGYEILGMDFESLSDTYKLALAKFLARADDIPITFHPDIVASIFEERDASPYFAKTPDEIESIHRKISSKDSRLVNEGNMMRRDVDLGDQLIRTKRTRAITHLVKQGYDRSVAMDMLSEMLIDNKGIMNLTPTRIAEMVDAKLTNRYKQ